MKLVSIIVLGMFLSTGVQGQELQTKEDNCPDSSCSPEVQDGKKNLVEAIRKALENQSSVRVTIETGDRLPGSRLEDEERESLGSEVQKQLSYLQRPVHVDQPSVPSELSHPILQGREELRKAIQLELSKLRLTDNPIRNWSTRASLSLNILDRELANAGIARRNGNLERAKQILTDALWAISDSIYQNEEEGGALTQTLVVRGLILATMLDMELPDYRKDLWGNDILNVSAVSSKYLFLTKYVRFMIDHGAFDQEVFIPRQHRRRERDRQLAAGLRVEEDIEFEKDQRRFLRHSADFLEFSLDFAIIQRRGQVVDREIIGIVPKGNEKVLLKVAEFVCRWSAHDIGDNIFGYDNGDLAGDLQVLSNELAQSKGVPDRGSLVHIANEIEGIAFELKD